MTPAPPSPLAVACPAELPCKCCGTPARRFGGVDMHKNCVRPRQTDDVAGVPVYYHRCPACGLLFTAAFDHFSADDFRAHIYNAGYAAVDPDYADARPRANAKFLADLLAAAKPGRVLDYGGGCGRLADLLRAAGFPDVATYDPFVPAHAARPAGRFDLVVSFEVAEHSPDPRGTFADLAEFLADPGLAIFSTLLQPADIADQGLSWWYAGPRNGHVSLHTAASIRAAVEPLGLWFGSFNANLHVLFRAVPGWAGHFVRVNGPGGVSDTRGEREANT